MKKVVLFFALIVGLLTSASTLQAQTVNMSRYITLTVTNGAAIYLNFKAAANGTPIRIVNGSDTRDITVDTNWYDGAVSYTVGNTTMTVYGDITGFNCSNNGANLTALDPSHNTQLEILYCSSNQLSSLDVSNNTQLTMLNCGNNKLSSLDVSHNTQLTKLSCYSNSLSSLDVSHNTQLKELSCYSNSLSSLDVSKNTQLEMLDCSHNNLNSLDVSKNTQLTKLYCYNNNFTTAALDRIYCALPDRTGVEAGKIVPIVNIYSSNVAIVKATTKSNATSKNWKVQYAAGTPVRIVSGSNTQDITVGTTWYDGHSPSSFTVTAGSTTITIYGDIIMFGCEENGANLTAIDPSHNTQLTVLGCSSNQLSSLDLSKNTELFILSCNDNKLTSLDISKKSKLKELYCYDNNFTTATLDDIYCSLPDRTGTTFVKIQPVYNSSSPNHATVLATNAQNATAKNWKVRYAAGDDIPATTGKHKCSATDIAEASAEQALTLYPNPVADVLYLSATARIVRIYNVYGIEVAHATDTDRVEVSHLPAGIYTVKADGTVAKMVKR